MSIDHRCNGAAKGLAILAFVVSFMACGGGRDVPCGDFVCDPSETADSCAKDCGCGNGVANPGEQCDGPDLGGGTCMDAVQRGGTLRCNADCTFDTTECTLASCGNGVAEEGESCDGTDLGTGTCASIGYGGGDLACSTDCKYDVSTCCTDACPPGMADCLGDSVRECAMSASGCLAWQVTDCAANGEVCSSSSGTATCSCVDRCQTVGDERCEGATIETCAEVAGGCLDWTSTTSCATGSVCTLAPAGPTCVPDVSAEDCAEPYPLAAGDNIVAWTALDADYLTSPPSCSSQALDGPDIVLSYTAPEDGFITFTLNKPTSTRWDVVVSSETCGTLQPQLACLSDFSPTTLTTELGVATGTTYYFYVRDTTSGSNPLDNPLLVTLDETRCSTLTPTAASVSPGNGLSIPDSTPIFSAEFDYPIDATKGVITLTGDMGTNLTFDLAMGPAEIAIINDGKTLQVDPGIVFPQGETVTVSWTGLFDATCAQPVTAPAWTVALTGPPYSITTGSTVYADACIGGTMQTLNGSDDEGRTNPINLPAGFVFFGQPAPQVVASTNGWLSVDTSVSSADFSNDPMPDDATPNGLIAPYWDDLDVITICTKVVGNTLVVQWEGALFSNNNTLVQFQAILDPSDNSIEYVYGPSQQADGGSATVGVEDHNGMYAVQASFNAAGSVTANSSTKLTPN